MSIQRFFPGNNLFVTLMPDIISNVYHKEQFSEELILWWKKFALELMDGVDL